MGINLLKSQDLMNLLGVTRNTLRFYEKKGLLKPARIDPATGYRYYGFAEIEKLHLILRYKESGMKLVEIKAYLEGSMTARDLERELNKRLEAIRNGLDILRSHEINENEYIVERIVVPECVCAVYSFVTTGPEVSAATFCGIWDQKKNQTLKIRHKYPDFAEWLDDEQIENGFFAEKMPVNLCVRVDPEDPPRNAVTYPSVEAVTTRHNGNYRNITAAYHILLDYMKKNNLVQNGHVREVYLLGPYAVDAERFITRIIIPVKNREQ